MRPPKPCRVTAHRGIGDRRGRLDVRPVRPSRRTQSRSVRRRFVSLARVRSRTAFAQIAATRNARRNFERIAHERENARLRQRDRKLTAGLQRPGLCARRSFAAALPPARELRSALDGARPARSRGGHPRYRLPTRGPCPAASRSLLPRRESQPARQSMPVARARSSVNRKHVAHVAAYAARSISSKKTSGRSASPTSGVARTKRIAEPARLLKCDHARESPSSSALLATFAPSSFRRIGAVPARSCRSAPKPSSASG